MTTLTDIADLYRRICEVTTRFDFTEPVGPEDLEVVRSAVAAVLPAGYAASVCLERGGAYVLVEVVTEPAGPRVYARRMIVFVA
jgi:hypothetical protein